MNGKRIVRMTERTICGRNCRLYACGEAQVIFLQFTDENEWETMPEEAQAIADRQKGFLLCAFPVSDWNDDLSPWEAPPVFGKKPFAGGAQRTFSFLTDSFLPEFYRDLSLPESVPLIPGGYSMAGLFALWCGYRTDRFPAVAAASPSVWFRGFADFARQTPFLAGAAALSLGNLEDRTKNQTLSTVKSCFLLVYESLKKQGTSVTFTEQEGNHFSNAHLRTAAAFVQAAENAKIGGMNG